MSSLVRYLVMIVIISIVCGLAVDAIYSAAKYDPLYLEGKHHGATGLIATASAALFSVMVVYLALKRLVKRLR
jgi:hypothetical protein